MCVCICTHTHKPKYIKLGHKKLRSCFYAATWMDLERILLMLSEISQTKRNTMWLHFYVESKKQNKAETIHGHRGQSGG